VPLVLSSRYSSEASAAAPNVFRVDPEASKFPPFTICSGYLSILKIEHVELDVKCYSITAVGKIEHHNR
jgi:hypothetical protein